MACSGRVYVLGAPVQSREEVEGLVMSVIRMSLKVWTVPCTLQDVIGPVRYDSSWVPAGKRKELRPGLQVSDLWTVQMSWQDPNSASSFSVLVMDQLALDDKRRDRRKAPGFETFGVVVLQCETAEVDCVYGWRTSTDEVRQYWKHMWSDRGTWLDAPSDNREQHRSESLDALRRDSWRSLWDLHRLVRVPHAAAASRRQRKTKTWRGWGFHAAEQTPDLDVVLPFGLDKFLASLVQRPRSFEQLCEALWEKEEAGAGHSSMPAWYRDTCATLLVESPEHLQQWWWASIMGASANAVQQLRACVSLQQRSVAAAVLD